LRVEAEVGDPAVPEHDDLDVLPADVDDHVRILDRPARGFGVGHRLDQGHVRLQDVVQEIFCVAGRADAQDVQPRAQPFELLPELSEELDRVLNGIAG
jgi:hypothetical protein